jgi:cyclopropane fatty-acyl-phospholipid synthase-like methyltransferase
MPPDLSPFHLDLTFMAPLSEERADQLVQFISEGLTGTVVDVGCGWAELLIRVLEAAPAAIGIGIDLKTTSIERARTLAQARGVANRAKLIAGDVKDHLPASAQAAICIGASQIWGPPVEAKLPLDYRNALRAVRSMLQPGARMIYGEGIWTAPPSATAVAPLAGRMDEYVFLPELLDIARSCGFAVIQVHQASLDEWDAFESGFTARYARWLASHPADHPDARNIREAAAAQSDAYFRGYRGVLGMAYLGLIAV